ncbi:MAG TPA: Ig-like domain-containing protein, partial [Vicinamibacterales bacterium]
MTWHYQPSSRAAVVLGTVVTPTLVSIEVSPSSTTVARFQNVAFTATGTYSDSSTADLTSSVTWSSSDATIATVSAGTATGVKPGAVTITADAGGGITDTATLTVTVGVLGGTTLAAMSAGSASIAYVAA